MNELDPGITPGQALGWTVTALTAFALGVLVAVARYTVR